MICRTLTFDEFPSEINAVESSLENFPMCMRSTSVFSFVPKAISSAHILNPNYLQLQQHRIVPVSGNIQVSNVYENAFCKFMSKYFDNVIQYYRKLINNYAAMICNETHRMHHN